MNMYDTGMIVNLTISAWSGHKLDKAKTATVTSEANADSDAARVNKHLVSKDALAGITRASNALRQYFYRATLPWGDNGDRLLSAAGFLDFTQEIARLTAEFDAAVDEFITTKYPAERARAQFRMGSLFDPRDYPAPESLRSRFGTALDIHGIPTSDDFRVALKDSDAERIKRQLDASNNQRLRDAMRTVWERLFEVVDNFATRMEDGGRFKEATVANLQDLADAIPTLNVTNDTELADLCKEIQRKLGGYTAKDLRTDDRARQQARQEAKAIVNRMSDLMAGFGSN